MVPASTDARAPAMPRDWAKQLRKFAYHVARRAGLDHDDAEDCAQECLLKLTQRFGHSLLPQQPVLDPETWMYRCVIHRVQDYRRHLQSEWNHRGAAPGEDNEPRPTPAREPADPHPTPEQALLQASCWRVIFAILAEPSRESFLCFLRRYCLGESVSEIAAATGLEPNYVSQIVLRAGKRLRKRLEEAEFTTADVGQAFLVTPIFAPLQRLTHQGDGIRSGESANRMSETADENRVMG